jgi:hypothetical protein
MRRLAMASHAADPGGTTAEPNAVLERAAFTFHDWMGAPAALADVKGPHAPACSASWARTAW